MLRDAAYEVARPTGRCAVTGRPITPGEAFVAVLVERDQDERLERRDYTLDAWGGGAPVQRSGLGARVVASWRALMPRAGERGRRLIDDEALADLFEQVVEPDAGERNARAAFRYLLALLLIRRRLLRHAGARPGVLLVRRARDGERAPTIEVADPGMDEATISAATEQLSAVLLGGEPGEGRGEPGTSGADQ